MSTTAILVLLCAVLLVYTNTSARRASTSEVQECTTYTTAVTCPTDQNTQMIFTDLHHLHQFLRCRSTGSEYSTRGHSIRFTLSRNSVHNVRSRHHTRTFASVCRQVFALLVWYLVRPV